MLRYLLIEETEGNAIYKYFPENGSDFGIVSYDKKADKYSIVTLSKNDKHQRYAQKMFSKLREFANIKTFSKEGRVAWL